MCRMCHNLFINTAGRGGEVKKEKNIICIKKLPRAFSLFQ